MYCIHIIMMMMCLLKSVCLLPLLLAIVLWQYGIVSQCTGSLNQQFAVLVHVLYVACKVIALFEERRVVNCFHVTL